MYQFFLTIMARYGNGYLHYHNMICFGNRIPYINGTFQHGHLQCLLYSKYYHYEGYSYFPSGWDYVCLYRAGTTYTGIYSRSSVHLVGLSRSSWRREAITVVVLCIMMAPATVEIWIKLEWSRIWNPCPINKDFYYCLLFVHSLRSLYVSVQSTNCVFHVELYSVLWFDTQNLPNFILHLVWNIVRNALHGKPLLSPRTSVIKLKFHPWQRIQLGLHSLSGRMSYHKNS